MSTLNETQRQGYALYVSSGFSLTFEAVNAELSARGHRPIGYRTYRHYRSMGKRGLRDYMPINEFDMAVKHGEVPPAA